MTSWLAAEGSVRGMGEAMAIVFYGGKLALGSW